MLTKFKKELFDFIKKEFPNKNKYVALVFLSCIGIILLMILSGILIALFEFPILTSVVVFILLIVGTGTYLCDD